MDDRPARRGDVRLHPRYSGNADRRVAFLRVCGNLIAARALSMQTSWMGTPRLPSSPAHLAGRIGLSPGEHTPGLFLS
jgi:hypothetical protein